VDLQVEYFGIERKFLVMISVEGKHHGAGQAFYDEVEVRAYMTARSTWPKACSKIYAVTVAPANPKIKTSCQCLQMRVISFSDKEAYLETNSTDGAKLHEQLALVEEEII